MYFSWQKPYLAHQSSSRANSWDPWLPSELYQGCRNLSSSFGSPVGHLQGTVNKELYAEITLLQSCNWAGEPHQQFQGLKKRHVLTEILLIRCVARCWIIASSSPRVELLFANLSAFHPQVWHMQRYHLDLYLSALSLVKCPLISCWISSLLWVTSYSAAQLHKKHHLTTPGLPELLFCQDT